MRRSRRKVVFYSHIPRFRAKPIFDAEPMADKSDPAFLSRHVQLSRDNKPPGHTLCPASHTQDMAAIDQLYHHSTDRSSYLLRTNVLTNPVLTQTSALQAATVREVLPLLDGINSADSPFDPFLYSSNGLLTLQRDVHVSFLQDALSQFPGSFVSIDASRPWMVYWALTPLHLLGEDISQYRRRVVKTFLPLQNPTGGFGGGQGHLSHLACAYPTILSLACVGGQEAWRLTDRKAMWEWLGRLKQSNGGFSICEGGEQDCRGAYCALVIISLLNLPWELPPSSPARQAGLTTFGDRLGQWIRQCQSYEGGISATPGSEAHGAYTFCAIACLCLLGRPDKALRQWLDFDALVSWLSARQYAPEGGLAGRTNKVVDGCYSQWIGGCWPLVQAALRGPESSDQNTTGDARDLYSTEGLARYILNCCQNPHGGLRDKPSKRPDSYHSCYTLVGISTIEHLHTYTKGQGQEPFASAFAWSATSKASSEQGMNENTKSQDVFDPDCRLNALHPVYVIPYNAALKMREWALQQESVL